MEIDIDVGKEQSGVKAMDAVHKQGTDQEKKRELTVLIKQMSPNGITYQHAVYKLKLVNRRMERSYTSGKIAYQISNGKKTLDYVKLK